MLGVEVGARSGGVEVIGEGLLGLIDCLGFVLGGYFGEVWEFGELCGGGEVASENGVERE